jgi:hypothetical protein
VGYEKKILSYFGGINGSLTDEQVQKFLILPKPPLPEALTNRPETAPGHSNNSYLTISYFVANTGKACEVDKDCDCDKFEAGVTANDEGLKTPKEAYDAIEGNFTYDDIILHPGVSLYEYYHYTTYATVNKTPTDPITKATRLADYQQVAYKFALENAAFNCRLLKKSQSGDLTPSNNAAIITELYYEQPQLFGFPILSVGANNPMGAPVTDPVYMYSQTAMRLMASSRKGIDATTTGPVCAPFPIVGSQTLREQHPTFKQVAGEWVPAPNYADAPLNIYTNQWASWGGSSDSGYLKNEIKYPQMGLNEYDKSPNGILDAANKSDPVQVLGLPGDTATLDDLEAEIKKLAGQEIIVPLINGGSFAGAAKVILNGEADLNPEAPGEPYIYGYLLEGAKESCLDTLYCKPGDAGCNCSDAGSGLLSCSR